MPAFPRYLLGFMAVFASGSALADASGTWGLPLMADTARSRGVSLPKPLGVGAMYVHYREDLQLDDLKVSADTGQRGGIDFVELSDSELTTDILQLRFDAWLFPFMNLFALVGLVDNEVKTGYSFTGSDLAEFLGDGSRCAPDASPRPAFCDRTFTGEGGANPEGTSYSVGTLLAAGRGSYFALAGLSYTWNSVDTVDTTLETLAVSPRLGRRLDLGERGQLALYLGALYLDSDIKLSDRFTIPGPDGDITVTVSAYEKNAERWSYLAGANWDLSSGWSLQAEFGYGDSREGAIASVTRRF